MGFSEAWEDGESHAKGRTKEMKAFAAVLTLSGLIAVAAQADPLSTYDDVIVSADVMDECHIVISGWISDEKTKAAGDAAFHQLWSSLDEQDSTHHEGNGRKADFVLKKRTEADLTQGRKLVTAKGCPSLIRHARKILEAYRR